MNRDHMEREGGRERERKSEREREEGAREEREGGSERLWNYVETEAQPP